MKIQVIKKAEKKPSDNNGCAFIVEQLPSHGSSGHFVTQRGRTMKIQMIKKAEKKPSDNTGCAFIVEQPLEPRR